MTHSVRRCITLVFCAALVPGSARAQGTQGSSQAASPATAPAAAATTPAPVKATPRKKRWDFNGSAGFAQTNGNARALTTNVNNKLKYSMAGWSILQDIAFFYGEANEKVNTNFWNGGLRGERTVAARVSLFLASRYDRNVVQGVQNRFQQGFGVSYVAVDDKRNKLNVALGGSLFQQQLTPGSVAKVSRAFPAARAAFDFRHRFSELAYLQQSAEYLPAIGDTATAYFVNTESAVVAPISKNVGLKIGYVIRYNSEPPVRNSLQLKTTDTFFSSGLTLTF
jgi:putative salt-induced outer membrane protein